MTDDFAIVTPDDVPAEPFPASGTRHRKLTEALGCVEVRVNAVSLGPGESTAPHTHHRQEEVYVALDGGHVEVDGTLHVVPPRGLVRVGPGVVRCVRNTTPDEEQTWLMVGAPPVGTADDFGEYAMPPGGGPDEP